MSDNPLAVFSADTASWFRSCIGEPTAVQREAWPVIARSENVLATAPTGSGKTLTAFLYALDQFASRAWQTGHTRVLYVSPLKALNNDIQHNLITPLSSLREYTAMPPLHVATRSGDTSQSERQRLLRRPPDILITTPESLALLLTSTRGRAALSQVETVILDEVHALASNRRGVSLATSIERLAELSVGPVQRIALSATVEPIERIAQFIAGRNDSGTPRPIKIINPDTSKSLELTVRYPEAAQRAVEQGEPVWGALAEHFRDISYTNRSTLFFTNSRMLAERIALKMNDANRQPGTLAWAHHGSLARDIRAEVERRLKNGELRAIVATSSLEMGIDIGELDEVVMVQSPPGIAGTLQRLGRAGHRVDAVSRGRLYPIHDHDFLEAAVLTRATLDRDIEPLKPIEGALDMLAQFIISCTATETRRCDDLYRLLRRTEPYHKLSREAFERVLEQLAGRYRGARVRTLMPRIDYDRINGTVGAKKSALLALYNGGGSIPDRGYYQIRHSEGGARIGELDEEFVWEAKIGDVFSLGTQHWQVQRITHNDVFVAPARHVGVAPPFWRAERIARSTHFATRVADFLRQAEVTLQHDSADLLTHILQADHHFDDRSAMRLLDYLQRQRELTGSALPHSNHLVLEHVRSGPDGYRGPDLQNQFFFHTIWGGQTNRPFALALGEAWREVFDETPEVHSDNDAVVLLARAKPSPEQALALVSAQNLDGLLRRALEGSGFFGARFREVCGRFLLLPRQHFNQRLPLWMSRVQAKKLMSATRDLTDFPVMLETWRTCLQDEFDLDALRARLIALADGETQSSYVETEAPSPFARSLSYDQIAPLMYADDTPEHTGPSQLNTDLILEAVHNPSLRPDLNPQVCAEFVAKRQRSHPDYRPETPADWRDWVRERVLLPESEWWSGWLAAPDAQDDHLVILAQGARRWVCHIEQASALVATGLAAGCQVGSETLPKLDDARDSVTQACEVLSFYGPLTREQIEDLLPSMPDGLLEDTRLIANVQVHDDSASYIVDAENLEIILRWQRAASRAGFDTLPVQNLPVFLAFLHGFGHAATDDNLIGALDRLRGYRAPIATLEDFFLSRFSGLQFHQIDAVFSEIDMRWRGHARQRISLHYDEDVELLFEAESPESNPLLDAFSDPSASYSFQQIREQTTESHQSTDIETSNTLWWQAVWAGHLSSDALSVIHRAAASQFQLAGSRSKRSRDVHNHRSIRQRARSASVGWPGLWRRTRQAKPPGDSVEQLELARERVHLLLDRYGVVNRDLINREVDDSQSAMAWRQLFQALRIMELSGEVVQGLFFEQLAGPQFASPSALKHMRQQPAANGTFWCSALDPISPCGLGLDWPDLPQRRAQNYLSFSGGDLALVVLNRGRQLHFHIDPQDDNLGRALELLEVLAKRARVCVQTINGDSAIASPWRVALEKNLNCFSDHKAIYIENRD